MKDPGSYANPINSSFQKFRTTSCVGGVDQFVELTLNRIQRIHRIAI